MSGGEVCRTCGEAPQEGDPALSAGVCYYCGYPGIPPGAYRNACREARELERTRALERTLREELEKPKVVPFATRPAVESISARAAAELEELPDRCVEGVDYSVRGPLKPSETAGESREEILRFFEYAHLPHAPLRYVSSQFGELAQFIVETIPMGAERSVALRKLLEAKDAAVRAML